MIVKYELPARLSADDFTATGGVRPSSLLHLFQEIAKAHAEHCGMGFDALMSRGLIWVITKLKYRVAETLKPDIDYSLVTYPKPNGSLMYQRDFYLLSDGREIVSATSQWCIVNFLTRHVEQATMHYDGEIYEKDAFPKGIERIRPGELSPAGRHIVTKRHLDENDHTNNCRYADMAIDALGSNTICEFTINFAKETRLGDEIQLFTAPGNIAAGKLPDGTLVFAAGAK
ncbi:MAG: acyl-[acyl-carrier-protein] thioesterase [Oscillospiraceae bacterium]